MFFLEGIGKINKEAIFWYVRIQSPTFSKEQERIFFDWLAECPEHQVAFLSVEQAWLAGGTNSVGVGA